MHFELIRASLHIGRDIHAEGIIAIGPIACFLTIQVDGGLGHGTIEEEFGMGATLGNLDGATIEAFANPG